jgi:hypothetical protein
MSNVFERKIPRPSTIGLSPPPAFDAIVLRALERDPDRRFQSAAELASELRDVARGAGCLAATDEVGQWVTTTFGGELAAGRRTLLEIAARGPVPPSSPTPEVSVLLQLGAARPAEAPARDAQSPDELSRVTEPAPLLPLPDPLSSAPPLRSPVAEFRLDARPRAPRMLVIAAFAAFGAVVIVLGGRWAMARAPVQDLAVAAPPRPEDRAPAPPELEVTVLAVRTFVPPSPDAVPPRPDLAPAPAIAPAPPSAAPPAPVAAPAAAPPRSVARGKRPARSPPEVRTPAPARPSDVRPEPPDTRAPEAHPAAPPTRPESPSKPALETNPYLYK